MRLNEIETEQILENERNVNIPEPDMSEIVLASSSYPSVPVLIATSSITASPKYTVLRTAAITTHAGAIEY